MTLMKSLLLGSAAALVTVAAAQAADLPTKKGANFTELRHGFLNYLPVGFLVGAVLLVELLFVVGAWAINPSVPKAITAPISSDMSNTQALGLVLYTRYVYYFEAAGVILLVAMIGAIVLTLHHKPGVKRQSISEQSARRRSSAIEIVKVKSGQGLS